MGILAAGAAVLIHYVLPYVWVKRLHRGAIWHGGERPLVVLTIDDGPDPETTPLLLDALALEGVRATFFVQGDRAAEHPVLVRRMLAEGHEVGSHGYHHVSAARQRPWESLADIERSAARLAKLTGRRPRYYRPPYGFYTLAVLLGAEAAGLEPVHWTLDSRDWREETTAPQILAHLSDGARPGSIILLHDRRPTGVKTARLLPPLIRLLRARGLEPATLSEALADGEAPSVEMALRPA